MGTLSQVSLMGFRDVEGIDNQGQGNNTVTAVSLVYSIIWKGSVRKVSTAQGIRIEKAW
jgi:hypothetical protein